MKIKEKRNNGMSILNSILKGTANVLSAVADRDKVTTGDRIGKAIKNSMMKDDKLQFALIAFKDRYEFGMCGITIEPKLDDSTMNVVGWSAEANDKVIIKTDGLDEMYSFFAKGVITMDPDEIAMYKKITKSVLS